MKRLTPIRQLIPFALKQSVASRFRWVYLILGCLLVVGRIISTSLPINISNVLTDQTSIVIIIAMLLFIIVQFVLSFLYLAFVYKTNAATLLNQPWSVTDVLQSSWRVTGRLIGVSLLTGLIMLTGFILIIIPAIMFSVWFVFAGVIAVVETGPVDALKESKHLVTGYFWPVTWRLFIIGLLLSVPGMLLGGLTPMLQTVWSVTSPYSTLLIVALYLDLKRVKAIS